MLTSVIAAALLVFLGLKRPLAHASAPRSAVPATSFIAVSVDVKSLRTSPIFATIFGKDRVLGVKALRDACGFDPLTRIDELDVAIPEGGLTGDFGVAANGTMSDNELAGCAQKILASRGSAAAITREGAFTRISDEGGTRLAFREGGPFLVGRGAWLETMIEAAEKRRASIDANPVHAQLRATLEGRAGAAIVVGTAILPQELRDRLKREMGAEASGNESQSAMAGILGVFAAGLALRVTGSPAALVLEADLELRCETAEACAQVQKVIERKRLAMAQDFGFRLVGLGPVIDGLKVETHGTSLTASTQAPVDDVSAAVDRILSTRNRSPEPPRLREPGSARPDEPRSPKPDETLRSPTRK